jgi:3-hydroxyisobutyrate dehydrogenase-like beta-hydroxyacid dehydrogenase
MSMKRNVGLIGVGMMGHGIAHNLVRHGHRLRVLEHPGNQPIDDLKALGVTTVGSPAELAVDTNVVVLCVTGSPQVEAVLEGDDGVLKTLAPGTVVIDCSTAVPSSTARMAARVAARGGRFLDAPMTRTPKEAREGRLNLLVGGDDALFAECRPLLACFAEHITHVGPIGAGHRMKLLHNFVSLGMVSLLAEAAACAERTGVAAEVFVDVLAKGGGGGVALERLRPFLTDRDPSRLRFSIANAHKDLSYYTTMAHESGAAQGIADAVLQALAGAIEAGQAQAMLPEITTLLARGR